MFQQYVPREKSIYAGQAATALSIGTVVKAGSTSGSLTPITADSDVWLGVVTADVAAGDSTATIALRSGNGIVTGKLSTPANFGVAVFVTGSSATFTTASNTTNTITVYGNPTYQPNYTSSISNPAGWTLQAGSANDLVDIKLA